MNYKLEKSETVVGRQAARQSAIAGFSNTVASAWRDTAKGNFLLQMGFEDPAPALRSQQYSALVFQPKIVLITIVAGVLLQSPMIFTTLGTVLWWSALFPKLNPISALYNQTLGRRPGAFRLGPAPTPRRAAETEAGTIALAIALLIHSGFILSAHVFEAIFLTASLAVLFASFCTGTFLYHMVRGRWEFARQTLPWAN